MFFIFLLNLCSCYVAVSDIEDDSKTKYFIVVGIIVLIIVIFGILLS